MLNASEEIGRSCGKKKFFDLYFDVNRILQDNTYLLIIYTYNCICCFIGVSKANGKEIILAM